LDKIFVEYIKYEQLFIAEGCLLVYHTHELKQELCSSGTLATSPREAVNSWRGTKARSICRCAITPGPVFLQTHPLLIAQILFRKAIITTLHKTFHPWQIYLWADGVAGYTKNPDRWAFCI